MRVINKKLPAVTESFPNALLTLFPDAKFAENIAQNFIIGYLTRNFTQKMHAFPNIL